MKGERDIGKEILDGIRDLKRGKSGRVINVPNVAERKNRVVAVALRGTGRMLKFSSK